MEAVSDSQEATNNLEIRTINDVKVYFYPDEIPNGNTLQRIQWAREQQEQLEPLVSNPNVGGVMIEYFSPELKSNARNSSSLAQLIIQTNLDTSMYINRVFGFNYLARLAKKYHKDVYVADIANKPAYQALRTAWGYAPGTATALAINRATLSPLTLGVESGGLSTLILLAQEFISRFTTKKNKLEDFIPTPEDARRLFIAKGINEITKRMEKGKTLLVVYPEAHVNRIIGYLENKSKKENFYKMTLPGLDYFVRRYRPDQSNNEANRKLSGWQLIEKIPL